MTDLPAARSLPDARRLTALLRRSAIWIAIAVLFVVLPLIFDSGFALTLLSQMGVLIVFALAYNMLLGQGGMLSFGHAIYFGLAGYMSIHFLNLMAADLLPFVPISLLPLLGGLVGLFFGIIIGFVSTRRAGTVFAMISLGFGEMVTALTLIFVAFFNGEEGIQADRWLGPEPLGITFGPQIQVYYLIVAWCLICMVAMYLVTKTPFGRISNAVRDNPERAQFVGYNTQRVRWLAFALSSFFAGMAGSLHAINYEHVGFETVSLAQSGLVLFMVYIGGVGHFMGPILGAVLITYLNGTLSDYTEAWLLYQGLLFCTIVLFAPGGLAGIIMIHQPIWRTDVSLLRLLVAPYGLAIATTLVALAGAIGIIEMLYFLSVVSTDQRVTSIYGVSVDASSVVPWIAFAAIAALGVVLCRRVYPGAARSWNAAMAEVKARIGA